MNKNLKNSNSEIQLVDLSTGITRIPANARFTGILCYSDVAPPDTNFERVPRRHKGYGSKFGIFMEPDYRIRSTLNNSCRK